MYIYTRSLVTYHTHKKRIYSLWNIIKVLISQNRFTDFVEIVRLITIKQHYKLQIECIMVYYLYGVLSYRVYRTEFNICILLFFIWD